MPAYIEQKALEIARRIAAEHKVDDAQTIARFQLVAIETLKETYGPYEILSDLEVRPEDLSTLSDTVFHAALPTERWAKTDDIPSTQLTLARQRRWIADAIKDLVRTGRIFNVNTSEDSPLRRSLVDARAALLTMTPTDNVVKVITAVEDSLLALGSQLSCICLSASADDAYDAGGPMSGKRRPPPCRATTHRR